MTKLNRNPYKFIGPLDPVEDILVCMPREKDKNRVVSGVLNGDYWTILGPRQIGKTTFLRQLMGELSAFYCIYINFEVSPKDDEKFYKWIIERISEAIPHTQEGDEDEKWKHFGPELHFLNFLEKFQPKEDKRIIFFFDDMEKAHCVRSFLHLWRKVFHERYHRPELKKYGVITAGKVDLGSLSIGETSPFNISRKLELTNLPDYDAEKLIEGPFKKCQVKMDTCAKEKFLDQVSGHPQLMQHLCYILVEYSWEEKTVLTSDDIENTIKRLFFENDNLKALEKEFRTNKILENLSRQILEGRTKDFIAYRDLSITGTGPVIPMGHYCSIRNKIYERVIQNLLKEETHPVIVKTQHEQAGVVSSSSIKQDHIYMTTVFLAAVPGPECQGEAEKKFLKQLFDVIGVRIRVKKDLAVIKEVMLNRTEKLVFCYLVYQNYKACQSGITASMRRYHLSSVPRNNSKQKPEWDIFADAVNLEGNLNRNSSEPDGTIRAAVFSIRKKLKSIGCEDLIPRQTPGGGEGYWLKGEVEFLQNEL